MMSSLVFNCFNAKCSAGERLGVKRGFLFKIQTILERALDTELGLARVSLPYIQGVSEAIRRVLGKLDIQTGFKPLASIRNILCHSENPTPQESIYRIPCTDYSKSYVGQTGRNLSQRIEKHCKAVEKFYVEASALAEYVFEEDHWITWEDASILDQHPVLQSRCIVSHGTLTISQELLTERKGRYQKRISLYKQQRTHPPH